MALTNQNSSLLYSSYHGTLGRTATGANNAAQNIPNMTSDGIVLNQRHSTINGSIQAPSSTLTFSFSSAISKLTLNLIDLSVIVNNYVDEVSFNQSVTVTGDMTNIPNVVNGTLSLAPGTKMSRNSSINYGSGALKGTLDGHHQYYIQLHHIQPHLHERHP